MIRQHTGIMEQLNKTTLESSNTLKYSLHEIFNKLIARGRKITYLLVSTKIAEPLLDFDFPVPITKTNIPINIVWFCEDSE